MPRDQNLPVNQKTGAPLYLLAQLNFEQIPHIKDFPEKDYFKSLLVEMMAFMD